MKYNFLEFSSSIVLRYKKSTSKHTFPRISAHKSRRVTSESTYIELKRTYGHNVFQNANQNEILLQMLVY